MSNTVFLCKNIGLSGTTEIHVREEDGKFEARMGFALMGATNMDEAGFKAANYDPFHEKFYDNYIDGFGDTQEEAIESLQHAAKSTADSLWF